MTKTVEELAREYAAAHAGHSGVYYAIVNAVRYGHSLAAQPVPTTGPTEIGLYLYLEPDHTRWHCADVMDVGFDGRAFVSTMHGGSRWTDIKPFPPGTLWRKIVTTPPKCTESES